jgi:hypothetical protein
VQQFFQPEALHEPELDTWSHGTSVRAHARERVGTGREQVLLVLAVNSTRGFPDLAMVGLLFFSSSKLSRPASCR